MEDTSILDYLQYNLSFELLKEIELSELSLREFVINKIQNEQNDI
jgi:hypothetical protein